MRGTTNWTFNEVVEFLTRNGFVKIGQDSSHHIYQGWVNGRITVVEVQNHTDVNGAIPPGTFRQSVIVQSRIPASEWYKYTKLSPTLRKKYIYKGCKTNVKEAI